MSNTTTTPFPQVSNLTTVAPGATADLLGYGGILLKFGKRERQLFFNDFLKYGICFVVLLTVSWYLLWKMRFRFDRVDAFITTSGRCKKITEKQHPDENIKRVGCRIWWLSLLIQVCLVAPAIILVAWGISVINNIPNAPMMGIGITTLWLGWLIKVYTICLWKSNGWSLYVRRSKLLLKSLFAVSLLLILLFELIAVLIEDRLDFTGVSWAFMTLNLMPLIVLVHSNEPDVAMTKNVWRRAGRVDSTAAVIQANSITTENPVMAGEEGNSPENISSSGHGLPDGEDTGHTELKLPSINFQSQASAHKNVLLYGSSILILVAYVLTFLSAGSDRVADGVATVSIAVSCAILLLDFILYLVWKGHYVTRPHKLFIIMLLCRAGLISFGFRYWFLGQSTMFLIFGVVIAKINIDFRMQKSLDAKKELDAAAAEELSPEDSTEVSLQEKISLANGEELDKYDSVVKIISSRPIYAFAILVIAFIFLLVVVIVRSVDMLDVNILGKMHKQSEFGFASLYGTAVFLLFYWTVRSARTEALLQNSRETFYFGRKAILIATLFYAVTVIGGIFLYSLTISGGTSTPHILFSAICLPPMILSSMLWYTKWRIKDFKILSRRSLWKHDTPAETEATASATQASAPKDIPAAKGGKEDDEDTLTEKDGDQYWDTVYRVSICDTKGCYSGAPIYENKKCVCRNWTKGDFRKTNSICAFVRMGLPREDYIMFGLSMIFLIATITWGVGISTVETSDNTWVKGMGYAIIFITLLITATIIPIIEWFNRLQVSSFMVFMGIFCFALHVGFHMYIWIYIQNGEINLNAAGTLFSSIMYPTLVLIFVALYKLRDDKWKLSRFVNVCAISSQVIVAAFSLCIIFVFDEATVGAILLIAQFLFLFLVGTIFLWVKNNYYLPKAHKVCVVLVLGAVIVAGFVAGLAGSGMSAFVAFSASWFTICALALGAAVATLYPAYLNHQLLFSENVFPVFMWDPDTNNVKLEYFGICNAYLSLYLIYIWGVVATIFLSPVYVGMGFASVALVTMFCLTLSLEYLSKRMFSQAVVNIKHQDDFENMMTGQSKNSLSQILNESEIKALKYHDGAGGTLGIQRADSLSHITTKSGGSDPGILRVENAVYKTERMKKALDDSKAPSAADYRHDIDDIEKFVGKFYSDKLNCSCAQLSGAAGSTNGHGTDIEMGSTGGSDNGEEKTQNTEAGHESTGASSDPVELISVLEQLLETDVALRIIEFQDQKLSVLYRAFVQLSANSRLLQAEADFSGFLSWCRGKQAQNAVKEAGMTKYFGKEAQKKASIAHKKLSLKEVFSWATSAPESFAKFKLLTLTFRKAQVRLEEERKRKEEEERRAEEKRKELLRKAEEERIRKQAEEWQRKHREQAERERKEQERREAEARKRLEEKRKKEEEEERRRREAEDRELERLKREKQREIEEENRRKEAERRRHEEEERKEAEERKRIEESRRSEEERERKRKELEERRRKREEERRKREEERKRLDDARNNGNLDPREAKRREIQRKREERRKRLQESRERDAQKLKEENERNRMAMLARQAAEGAGGELTEEQILQRDFQKDGNDKYFDKVFSNPQNACRINPNKKAADRIEKDGMQWVRPQEFMRDPKLVIVDENDENEGFGFADIQQGQLGDCWLLAAMTVLACHPEYMDKVLDIQGNQERAKQGYYRLNIYRGGKMVPILVDDKVMCVKTNNRNRPYKPIFAKSRDENELWPIILEKAYARFHGSFEAINGGFVHVGLVDFTGGFGSAINLSECSVDINSGALFKRLLDYVRKGFLMGAGSPSGSDSDISEAGIVQGHAYAVLDIKEESDANGDHQLIRLRNPWGQTEWTGDWSDDDRIHWTSRMKQRLAYRNSDDGCFWMSFQDFCQNYSRVYLCQTFRLVTNGGQFYSAVAESSWQVSKKFEDGTVINTAGGFPSRKHKNSANNPSFLIKVSRPCTLYISVQQRSISGPMATEHHQMLHLLKKVGKRVGGLYRGDKVATSGQYINSEMITCEQKVDEYLPGYTLYCSTYEENCEAKLTVRVYSDAPLSNVEYVDGCGVLPALGQDVPIDDGRR